MYAEKSIDGYDIRYGEWGTYLKTVNSREEAEKILKDNKEKTGENYHIFDAIFS